MSINSQAAKQVKKQLKADKMATDMSGAGMYVFENNTAGDLHLPRPTQSGRRLVRKGEQFLGDNYYFSLLRNNELKLIREIQSPEQKLITEQPPTVTHQGTVEYVSNSNINETPDDKQQDILLTETPIDGIKILK
jgi:hypothetical protein